MSTIQLGEGCSSRLLAYSIGRLLVIPFFRKEEELFVFTALAPGLEEVGR